MDERLSRERLWHKSAEYVYEMAKIMGKKLTDREANTTIVRVYETMEFLISPDSVSENTTDR